MSTASKAILKSYLVILGSFLFFRGLLCLNESEKVKAVESLLDFFKAFFIGFRFDIVITGYLMILPFVMVGLALFFPRRKKFFSSLIFYTLFFLLVPAFFIHAVDIPYFHQFFSRFNLSALQWIDHPMFVLKMAVGEWRYIFVMIPFFILLFFVYRLLKKIWVVEFGESRFIDRTWLWLLSYILIGGLILLGIRGRVSKKSPIRIGTAYFSDNPFLNQLGLNPVFTFIRSALDAQKQKNSPIMYMESDLALKQVKRSLNISTLSLKAPLKRVVNQDSLNKPSFENVILILMESMSMAKLEAGGNTKNLTPFLDSLARKSLFFNKAYSTGIHTFNGIYSTFFGMPAVMRKHPMKGFPQPRQQSIFSTLKNKKYITSYFTTHDAQFDNVEGFLRSNGCEHIYSEKDYPSEKILSTLGVPDDYLFEYSIPKLNSFHRKDQPFIAAFMTASDHGPWTIPNYFNPNSNKLKEGIVEYADYSIEKFFKLAKKEDWFSSTLFVLMGDHGEAMNITYSMPLNYHHSPLIFYHSGIEAKIDTNLASQMDIYPTVMGFLNLSYSNYTFGIDLRKQKRDYVSFSSDDKFGVLDHEYFYIMNTEGGEYLHEYLRKNKKNLFNQKKEKVAEMKFFGQAQLQVYNDLWKTNSLWD